MTEKLYYADSFINEFEATVIDCRQGKKGFESVLDRTAFFPEGGGQSADTGYIDGVRVLDAREKGGEIIHLTESALSPGAHVSCRIDFEQRLRRMQNHSGEHIVSGISHRLYGVENVGFHMGSECMTIDFDKELSWEELERVETLANEAVRADIPVRCAFPDEETLKKLEYRSKLELTENVRIVEIEGIDRCACCAPHVKSTGQVGGVKLLDCMRHRGGVRISLVCGMDALDTFRTYQAALSGAARRLSVKRHELDGAVERLLAEQARQKERISALGLALAREKAAAFEATEGNICCFDEVLDDIALRELVNLLTEKCAVAAAFSGSDSEGWRYIIGSRRTDLRAAAREINAGISGRGGGRSEMIEGRASGSAREIENFMLNFGCLDKVK